MNKKNFTYFFLFLLLFTVPLYSSFSSEPEERTIEVDLGIDKVLQLDYTPATQVQVGNESIVTYQLIPQKREITLKGLKAGKTSLFLRNSVGDLMTKLFVEVTVNSNSKVVSELRELIGDIDGIEIGIKGGKVYVGGKIIVPSDIGKIVLILKGYPDVLSLVELSPQSQRIIAQEIQEEISRSSIAGVSVSVVNGMFWLKGTTTVEGDKERAQKIAEAYIPDLIENLARRTNAVKYIERSPIQNFIIYNPQAVPQQSPDKESQAPLPKQFKITAQFVELVRDHNRAFGFKWSPTLGGSGGEIQIGETNTGGVSTRSSGTLSGVISNLLPKLSSAKAAGHAKVIQAGMVIVENKKQGVISKTSEKPFALGSGQFTQPKSSVAGFEVKVTPDLISEEHIHLKVGVSISSNIGDPPEKVQNSVTTEVVLKSKESAAIGGMVIQKSSTDYDRNPPGGIDKVSNGMPLFSFLKSKVSTNTKGQFVVFITPEAVKSASEGAVEIRRKFRQRD